MSTEFRTTVFSCVQAQWRRPSPLAIVRERLFEQRVRGPLAIRDMRRFANGGRRPRHTNLRREFSFRVPLMDVQNSGAPRALPSGFGNTSGFILRNRRPMAVCFVVML